MIESSIQENLFIEKREPIQIDIKTPEILPIFENIQK